MRLQIQLNRARAEINGQSAWIEFADAVAEIAGQLAAESLCKASKSRWQQRIDDMKKAQEERLKPKP